MDNMQLGSRDYGDLTEKEKQRLAWKTALRTILRDALLILAITSGAALLICSVLSLALTVKASPHRDAVFMGLKILVLVAIFVCAVTAFLQARKDREYKKLFGEPPGEGQPRGWHDNTGEMPVAKRVNVEFQDGTKKWNIDPKSES